MGEALGFLPSCTISEAAFAEDKTTSTQNALGFTIETFAGEVRFRAPGQADFFTVKENSSLPMGSELYLSPRHDPLEYLTSLVPKSRPLFAREPHIALNHRIHGKVTFSGDGVVILSEDYFSRNLGGLRFAENEEIPSRIELKTASSKTPLERVFAFFMPRNDIPVEFPKSARFEMQQRFPIVIRYPDRVFLLKTKSLPTVVSLSWQSAPEHTKPYRIYLWTADQASSAPIEDTSATTATIQVSQYGRYYWQVEDRVGNFISAPRTLLVSALDDELAGPGTSDQLRPGKPDIFRQIRNIAIEFPVPDALIYGCPANGDNSLPVRFPHTGSDISRYELTVSPGPRDHASVQAPTSDGPVVAQVELPKEGTFSVKVLGYDKDSKVIATSEQLRGVFYQACGLGAKPEFLAQVFSVTKGRSLPDLGLLHVMAGAY